MTPDAGKNNFVNLNFCSFLKGDTSILLEKVFKSEDDKGPNIFLNDFLYM